MEEMSLFLKVAIFFYIGCGALIALALTSLFAWTTFIVLQTAVASFRKGLHDEPVRNAG